MTPGSSNCNLELRDFKSRLLERDSGFHSGLPAWGQPHDQLQQMLLKVGDPRARSYLRIPFKTLFLKIGDPW